MKDTLPNKSWKNKRGVTNLNNSNHDGSHWVSWVKEKYKLKSFDQFGIVNSPKEVVDYLGGNISIIFYGHKCSEFMINPENFYNIILSLL